MSITTTEIKAERAQDIKDAIEAKDVKLIRYYAMLEHRENNEEYGQSLYQLANRYERENGNYYIS